MKRIETVDAFRGLTIAGMVLVNSPGSWNYVYKPLLHAEWNGCTLADLVFPFFIFIVGISVAISCTKYLSSGTRRATILKKAFIRMLILFSIGVGLNLLIAGFRELRLPGVLQRIALVYFICVVLVLYINPKYILIFSLLVLLFYRFLLLIPPPDQGMAQLLPEMNIVNWVDKVIIPFRLYRETWDPEGLLSTLPAVVTGTSGIFAGFLLVNQGFTRFRKNIFLFLIALMSISLGLIWNKTFPVNKNLWTSSYVLLTSGLAFLIVAFFELLDTARLFGKWRMIFVIPGSNAITIYILHVLLLFPLVFLSFGSFEGVQAEFMEFFISAGIFPKLASLIWALLYTALCLWPARILYRRRIFLKV